MIDYVDTFKFSDTLVYSANVKLPHLCRLTVLCSLSDKYVLKPSLCIVDVLYALTLVFKEMVHCECECLKLVSGNHIENVARGKVSAQGIKGVDNFISLLKGVENTLEPLESTTRESRRY